MAAVLDGMSREEASRGEGLKRRTLRDWVRRFHAAGLNSRKEIPPKGHPPRLRLKQSATLGEIAETGPARARDGAARWRRTDLKRVIEERFDIVHYERMAGKALKQIGFSRGAKRVEAVYWFR